MIKKLLLIFSFVSLLTIAFSGTTYAAQEGEKSTESLASTLKILNNLYNEGIITEEEFSSARSMLLDPASSSGKKTKKALTAAERKRLKEIEEDKLKAKKKILIEEKRAEKQARVEEKDKACVDEYKASDATLYCTILKGVDALKLKKNWELKKRKN